MAARGRPWSAHRRFVPSGHYVGADWRTLAGLAVGIGIKAAKAGHRVLFDTATGWVARLQDAHSEGNSPRNWRSCVDTVC